MPKPRAVTARGFFFAVLGASVKVERRSSGVMSITYPAYKIIQFGLSIGEIYLMGVG
jgi:hypothetical protein